MVATSVTDAELSTETSAVPLDLVGTSELARLLRGKEAAEEHQALDRIAWQMLEGAQNLRRWSWTVILVALALLVIGFLALLP